MEQLEEEEETFDIENATLQCTNSMIGQTAQKIRKPAVIFSTINAATVIKKSHVQMIKKIPESVSRSEKTELPDVEILDHQQKDHHITDGGTVPDSQPATEGAPLERLNQIEASSYRSS
jgi:hypothetical protein